MEYRDFFEDDEMRILKEEFKTERRRELSKWISDNSVRTLSSAEFKIELLEEKAKRRAEKQSNP
jgi:hypothetical protein